MEKSQELISSFLVKNSFFITEPLTIPKIKEFFLVHGANDIKWWGNISIYEHTDIVAQAAVRVCSIIREYSEQEIFINEDYCELLAWLHDIGRIVWAKTPHDNRRYLFNHGYCGYLLVDRFGFSDIFSKVCMTHISGGISREEIEKDSLPLPFRNGIFADTLEEKTIVLADKLPWWNSSVVENYKKFLTLGKGTIYSELSSDTLAWERFWSIKKGLDEITKRNIENVF